MKTLYERFAETAGNHPDLTALDVDGETITYAELAALIDRAASRLAPFRGNVGLVANRRKTTYVGYLAAQQRGLTVVPLSPAFPQARIESICAAANLSVIMTHDDQFPEPGCVPILDLMVLPTTAGPGAAPSPQTSADDVAYILFTSGSTGAPKGVPVTQANVDAYLNQVAESYEIGPGSRVSQAFDLTFDPSVFDMFVTWSTGGTLVVPSRSDLMQVPRFIREKGITHWFSVPSLISLSSRLRMLTPDSLPHLKWSLFAGEPITWNQAKAWKSAAANSGIANLYGPTELTITCTSYVLPAEPEWPHTPNGTVPIGPVHQNMEYQILDEHGRAAESGELVMRGAQRFTGYLDAADNVGRFLPPDVNQASGPGSVTGDSWYRTGDRVTRTGSGLVHLGRVDDQVKVQGYRIELGEIEASIRAVDAVDEAVVTTEQKTRGDSELYAAYTGDAEPGEILDSLRRKLPHYMIPRRLVPLSAIPLNSNGKIDRKAIREQLTAATN